jgi:RNA polymerase sigma-70 factor (ECF subfamily)
VVRNVALRIEHARAQTDRRLDTVVDPPARERTLSEVFDQAWARALVRQASARQAARAREAGPEALQRVEILRLRFQEGLPIREIATMRSTDPVRVHRDYARARREFRAALVDVVAETMPGTPPSDVEQECARLLGLFA